MAEDPTCGLLVQDYDGTMFDLDGVVYLGPAAVPGAADGIARLRELGVKVGFVTNNAARTPEAVAQQLRQLGVAAVVDDIVTSAQAGARLLAERFGPGAKVLAVGGAGVRAALSEHRLQPVSSADDNPAAVMQGYDPALAWELLTEAALAVQRGAHWLATNLDPTRPTDRGLVPGNGAAVQAVRCAVEVDPEVAGKPFPPLLSETIRRLGLRRPVFVGDRLDTDIAGADQLGVDSMLVLSGSHGPKDLLGAPAGQRPTHVGADLRALVESPRAVTVAEDGTVTCRDQTVRVVDGALQLTRPQSPSAWLDALWAAAHAAWAAADAGQSCDTQAALATLGGRP